MLSLSVFVSPIQNIIYLLLPLLVPLLLAVPFAVWTGSPTQGRALRRVGLLEVADPASHRGAASDRSVAARGAARTPAGERLPYGRPSSISLAVMAGVAALALLAPRLALGPEPSPAQLVEQQRLAMQRSMAARTDAAPTLLARVSAPRKTQHIVQTRPARMIDDEVRMRAFEAVARAQDIS